MRTRIAPFVLFLSVLAGGGGCSQAARGKQTPGVGSGQAPEPPLPTRAEAVARADALAVEGARAGQDGAPSTFAAAVLRRRIYRIEGTQSDALEAAELFRAAARATWPGACDAAVDLALLEGELKADPTAEYGALYAARARHRGSACAARIDGILASLRAFAPPGDVLAALDRAAPPGSAAPVAPRPTAQAGVVQPVLPSDASAEPASITTIERYGGKDAGRVVVFVTRPTLFEVGELAAGNGHGPRLFVDIKNATYRGKSTLPGEGLVERVRIGAQGTATRVVLDLVGVAAPRVFYLPEPFRLVVDVSQGPSPGLHAEKGPRALRRVVLDPGHGGHDPGALGAGGLREKDVVLDVAHRAAPLIARELGISTLLTRDSDAYVALDERVARANAFSADLFVSIHCNASEAQGSRGIMTFVLDASRDDLAARVAARENAASAEAAAELANVMSRVLDPASLSRSNHFASLLQRAAVASLTPHYPEVVDQGVKSAGFYVLAGARMPAALFEASFISNPAEERRLDTPDYRQKVADAIVNAVRAYRDGL